MFEHQLEIGVLEVALEEAQEDVDCEPGIRYVVMQCCGCWCVLIYRYVFVFVLEGNWHSGCTFLGRDKYFEECACVCGVYMCVYMYNCRTVVVLFDGFSM